jgi:VWFA-related protein
MKGSGIRSTGLVAALLSAYVISGSGQTAQTNQTPPLQPTFRTEANYVRVDVFPTKNGAPVLDLKQDDFEVFESSAPQRIEQFEHVVIRGNVPQEVRREPQTLAESRAAVADPRARVFVVFLDVGHVDIGGSHNIRKPLTDALNRVIGEDDLVGVMTPEMSALDVTFARKTKTIEGLLARHWYWGERDRLNLVDPIEQQYESCYGPKESPITAAMIVRRREKQTLDALEDLVLYLRGAREERKAILAITDGWLLYGQSAQLANALPPTPPPIGLIPGTGRLTIGTGDTGPGTITSDCERDRMNLASLDDQQTYRRILDEANRSNASFYPIDPRGLAVFDTPINANLDSTTDLGTTPDGRKIQPPPGPPSALGMDATMLHQRAETLYTLATATDGTAIITNDIAGALRRVVDDLSSYYLLGYYSTGKLDGKFHSITVRVKRPGVQVRARRGYLAATREAVNATARSAAPAASPGTALDPAAAAEARAVEGAIAPLSGYGRDVPLRLQVAAGWRPGDTASAAMWVVGELGPAALVGDSWKEGFDATAMLTTSADATVANGRVTVARGVRTFRLALTPSQPIAPGEYVLRVGTRAGPASIPSRDTLRIAIPPSPDPVGALFFRRGPATANRDAPTADLRFRRNEQVRVEIPTASSDAITARLLDRTGKPLALTVAAALREDDDGSRWKTGQLALSPLAPGDYVIELTSGEHRMLAAFRVVP